MSHAATSRWPRFAHVTHQLQLVCTRKMLCNMRCSRTLGYEHHTWHWSSVPKILNRCRSGISNYAICVQLQLPKLPHTKGFGQMSGHLCPAAAHLNNTMHLHACLPCQMRVAEPRVTTSTVRQSVSQSVSQSEAWLRTWPLNPRAIRKIAEDANEGARAADQS
jgi:hypothetical protein